MPSPHDSEKHKQAYDLYVDLKSYRQVAEVMGVEHHTIRRWSVGDINCDCPFHNWDALLAEKRQAENTRAALVATGITDPLDIEQALLDQEPCHQVPAVVEDAEIATSDDLIVGQRRKLSWKATLASDLLRISQLELLWAKFYFALTGVILDHSVLIEQIGGNFNADKIQEYLLDETRGGLQPSNAEQCLRCLLMVSKQIDEFKERLGLHKRPKPASDVPDGTPAATTDAVVEGVVSKKPLTLEELRDVRDRMHLLSEEQQTALQAEIRSENEVEIVPAPIPRI